MGAKPEVVILGAGILGCALAWRLAARKHIRGSSILVVDPNPVASQATSRAAALLSLARPAAKSHWIPLVRRTHEAVEALARAGHFSPLHRAGAIHLADSDDACIALGDYESTAMRHGVRVERVAPKDFSERLPWLDMSRFAEALWFPEERYTDPYQLTAAYASAARSRGVRFRLGKPASLFPNGSLAEVKVDGEILASKSIWICAGAWSDAVLSQLGAHAPQAAVRSHYWITQQTPLATDTMPMVLASDLKLYARPELGAILFGLRESKGVSIASKQVPADLSGFSFDAEDPAGHATLEAFAGLLQDRAPGLLHSGLRYYITGPSCYTPDGDFLVGPVPGWDNLKLLSGCNGAGIAVSAGLAEVAADFEAGAEAAPQPYLPARFRSLDPDAREFWPAAFLRAQPNPADRAGPTGQGR